MKIVLDTNVFVSGVFFRGPPAQILEAWRDGGVVPAVSAPILEEYRRVGIVLSERYEGTDIEPLLTLLAIHSELVDAPDLPEPVCEDPDDDKFLACALAGGVQTVVSATDTCVEFPVGAVSRLSRHANSSSGTWTGS